MNYDMIIFSKECLGGLFYIVIVLSKINKFTGTLAV